MPDKQKIILTIRISFFVCQSKAFIHKPDDAVLFFPHHHHHNIFSAPVNRVTFHPILFVTWSLAGPKIQHHPNSMWSLAVCVCVCVFRWLSARNQPGLIDLSSPVIAPVAVSSTVAHHHLLIFFSFFFICHFVIFHQSSATVRIRRKITRWTQLHIFKLHACRSFHISSSSFSSSFCWNYLKSNLFDSCTGLINENQLIQNSKKSLLITRSAASGSENWDCNQLQNRQKIKTNNSLWTVMEFFFHFKIETFNTKFDEMKT